MRNEHFKNILVLNFAMLCISTSGVIGRYITFPPPLTITLRSICALFFLGIICFIQGLSFKINYKEKGFILFITGVLMAIHWITYFYALQWSNVAIAMLSLFTYPMITTLLEPLFLKTPLKKSSLISCVFILIGIYFLIPNFDMNNSMTKGLFMGLFSSFSYSIRNLILKKQIDNINGSILMFYQMLVMSIILSPLLFIYSFTYLEISSQIYYVIFLGLITTAIGHTIFLNSFRNFSISTVSIMSSMQPIYGIILAIFFISEYPDFRSIIGGSLILFTVVLNSLIKEKPLKK